MTTTEYFADYQYQQYCEFVDTLVSEILCDTSAQIENFEFDDVPF